MILISVYYLAMLCATNSVVEDFYDVVNNNVNENISYEELERYKVPSFENTIYKNTDTKINRIYVMHNFNKGTMRSIADDVWNRQANRTIQQYTIIPFLFSRKI